MAPATMKTPTCSSTHSPGLNGFPAPSSRSEMRVSRDLFAPSIFSAVWLAWTSVVSASSSPFLPTPVTRAVYAAARSAPVSGSACRGAMATSTTSNPSPRAASPP